MPGFQIPRQPVIVDTPIHRIRLGVRDCQGTYRAGHIQGREMVGQWQGRALRIGVVSADAMPDFCCYGLVCSYVVDEKANKDNTHDSHRRELDRGLRAWFLLKVEEVVTKQHADTHNT
ncbi:hypothetical protein K504DRAFT_447049 [Pleomassaria siparia CBS 279.74]|uniref:Uncharacterized protein n=1 Tax=Pleomassaria siparia CBS 279.74 TaxID=1314801 RepID=A0A6G1K2M2_9PLEO|nr:hypothetical protein K504DRAFT_447049 [Pleomassaria siparia CBS 279.74]